jgi:hypothetical protein
MNKKLRSHRKRRRRGGQFGKLFRPEQFSRTDHPGRATSDWIHFIDGAATPPFQGGEFCSKLLIKQRNAFYCRGFRNTREISANVRQVCV